MGKKIFVTALTVFAFGFGCAPRLNAGTEVIEPYNAPAPDLQLRAATTAPNLLCSSSTGWRRRHPSGLRLLRAAVRVLPCPPILRQTRSLAFSSSLGLTKAPPPIAVLML